MNTRLPLRCLWPVCLRWDGEMLTPRTEWHATLGRDRAATVVVLRRAAGPVAPGPPVSDRHGFRVPALSAFSVPVRRSVTAVCAQMDYGSAWTRQCRVVEDAERWAVVVGSLGRVGYPSQLERGGYSCSALVSSLCHTILQPPTVSTNLDVDRACKPSEHIPILGFQHGCLYVAFVNPLSMPVVACCTSPHRAHAVVPREHLRTLDWTCSRHRQGGRNRAGRESEQAWPRVDVPMEHHSSSSCAML